MDLEAYFDRIGYRGPRDPSLETLGGLHESHLGAIPFENLDILLGRAIRLDLEALEEKLVRRRRGGYCFEQNTLFRAVLEELGFAVTSLAARVRMGTNALRPRTHMLLRVDIEGTAFIADVGFGGDGPLGPLRLADDAPERRHHLAREGDVWVLRSALDGKTTDLYAFTLEPQHHVDFEMASHFTSTFPRSPFVQTLTAQRVLPGRRLVLRDLAFAARDEAPATKETKETKETIRDPEHLLEVLREHFDLPFPPGTRFSRPVF